MKTIISSIIIIFFCVSSNTYAQEVTIQDLFLFSEYTPGKVLKKDKSLAQAPLNYNCLDGEIYFLNNNKDMILQELHTIDTIYIADRKFIPVKDSFCEVLPTDHGLLYIDWKTRVINIGKKGAMGQVTHGGTISKLDVKQLQMLGHDNTGNEVYRLEADNRYHISIKNKLKTFNNIKSFCKILSKEQEADIRSYISKEKIDLQKPNDVVELINKFM